MRYRSDPLFARVPHSSKGEERSYLLARLVEVLNRSLAVSTPYLSQVLVFSELGDSRAAENHSIMEDFITSTDCSQVALLKSFLASHHCLSSIEPLVCPIHTPPQREEEENTRP